MVPAEEILVFGRGLYEACMGLRHPGARGAPPPVVLSWGEPAGRSRGTDVEALPSGSMRGLCFGGSLLHP